MRQLKILSHSLSRPFYSLLLLTILTVSACSSGNKSTANNNSNTDKTSSSEITSSGASSAIAPAIANSNTDSSETATVTSTTSSKEKSHIIETTSSEDVKLELQKVSQIKSEPLASNDLTSSHASNHTTAHSSSASSSAHASHSPAGVNPEKSLGWLKNGNTRYRKGFLRKDGQNKKDIDRLSNGQQPHAIVLSCSDSRVPPEIVFDQKLGEIFVVRTAGQSLDPNAIGSIEYAVEHLGSKLIVVMGHTSCGAVKAALGTMNGEDAGSPSLNHLVADLHPRLQSFKNTTPSKHVEPESWANAKGVAKDLVLKSKILSEKIRSGEVKIVSALYHLGSGEVQFE